MANMRNKSMKMVPIMFKMGNEVRDNSGKVIGYNVYPAVYQGNTGNNKPADINKVDTNPWLLNYYNHKSPIGSQGTPVIYHGMQITVEQYNLLKQYGDWAYYYGNNSNYCLVECDISSKSFTRDKFINGQYVGFKEKKELVPLLRSGNLQKQSVVNRFDIYAVATHFDNVKAAKIKVEAKKKAAMQVAASIDEETDDMSNDKEASAPF